MKGSGENDEEDYTGRLTGREPAVKPLRHQDKLTSS
jgi:hypothetical protein